MLLSSTLDFEQINFRLLALKTTDQALMCKSTEAFEKCTNAA